MLGSPIDLIALIARAITFFFGFGFHEAAHAWAAYRLGDETARRAGRLTLNPIVHLDPLGYILAVISFIGWGKPTPVNPWRLRYGPRLGSALVAVAGPLTNLLLAALVALPFRFGWLRIPSPTVDEIVYTFILVNVALFVFNLIPLAPLDGISVLSGLVGESGARMLAPLRDYGPQILLGLILLSFIVPSLNILGLIIRPAMFGVARLLLG